MENEKNISEVIEILSHHTYTDAELQEQEPNSPDDSTAYYNWLCIKLLQNEDPYELLKKWGW